MFTGEKGELAIPSPDHRLLIPWRAPDGSLSVLQRRVIGDGRSDKYKAPKNLLLEHPYGVEQLRETAESAPVAFPRALDAEPDRRQLCRLSPGTRSRSSLPN
ncbi:MAG: hypothetical protein HUU21_00555 [Polyangiaceae bacterium]|nr:hypothetical protein [Polyangiaceae bacterium]